MNMRKNKRAWIAGCLLTVLAGGLAVTPVSAAARDVRMNDLMTFQERYEFWSKMREAKSPQERLHLSQRKFAELQVRAAERGVTIRDAGPGHSMPFSTMMAPVTPEAAHGWQAIAPGAGGWSPMAAGPMSMAPMEPMSPLPIAPMQPQHIAPRSPGWYVMPYGAGGAFHAPSPAMGR